MSISGSVLVSLGSGLAKWLAKRYLGDLSLELAGELLDFGKEKIPDMIERRNAARQFERYADDIVKRLRESVDTRRKPHPELDVDAVCGELSETLNSHISTHFLVAKDFDPRVIAEELRQRRPLPQGRLPELETRVYEQLLDEAVRYTLEVASLLPRFETAVAAESLKRLSNLGQDVADVLNTVQRLESRVVESTAPGQDARWEADYRAAVIRSLDRVELFGADIPPEAQRNLLSEAFVTLNVDTKPDRRMGTPASPDSEDASEPAVDEDSQKDNSHATHRGGLLTCEELFTKATSGSRRILIRGSAGSGKTTLLRWAAIEASGDKPNRFAIGRQMKHGDGTKYFAPAIDSRTGEFVDLISEAEVERLAEEDPSFVFGIQSYSSAWQQRIPFVVPLRNCQSGQLPAPDDLPLLIAKEIGRPPTNWVRQVLTEGRALVMLDGVDEVPAQNRAMLKDEIEAIVKAFPDCFFVLTSRPTAIPDNWLKSLDFINADISPMSMPDIERFVRRWHEATGKELARQGRPDANLGTDAEQLVEQFQQNPPLSLLATNPLLCAMICALHRVRHHKLPESQYELCETLCHMLLHKRERESRLNWKDFPAPYIALSYEQKRGIAQRLAQWLVHNGQSAMPLEAAYEQVARALQRIPGRTPDEAPLILQTLVERGGLLREPNPDVVDFLHNTFKELLAGDDLAARGDAESVMQHVDDESWRRVALFAVASPRSQTFADALVNRLLDQIRRMGTPARPNSANDSKTGTGKKKAGTGKIADATDLKRLKIACQTDKSLLRMVLFSLQCRRIAQKAFLDEHLEKAVGKLVSVPFPPADFEAAEAISQLGDAAVPLLIGPKKLSSKQAAATVRALRLINTQESRAELQRFINSQDWDVISELAQAVNPLTIPAVVTATQQSRALPDAIRKLVCDLSPLARLTSLERLFLDRTSVTDVSPLAAMTSLQALFLSDTDVTDVSPLAGMTRLKTLNLNNTGVRDLGSLAGMTNLQTLHLDRTAVADVSPLASMKNLKSLHLDGTGVTDLSPIAGLTNLQSLDLTGTGVSDVSPLVGMTNLTKLDLTGSSVSDLKPVSQLKNLQMLYLSGTGVSDLQPLAGLTNLRNLVLDGLSISDISSLAQLTSLYELHLHDTSVVDLRPLANLENLEILCLNRTEVIDLRPLASLVNLKRLNLKATAVKDVSPLATLSSLRRLDLIGSSVSDVSVLGSLTQLKIVGVSASRPAQQASSEDSLGKESSRQKVIDTTETFRLTRLDIANWRGFARRTFEFVEQVTVLIGNNGTGKSSTLEALSIGLGAWCGSRPILDADVRRVSVPADPLPRIVRQENTSVRCTAKWSDEPFDWLRTQASYSVTSPPLDAIWAAAKKAERQIADGQTVLLPVMAYYPANRNWQDARLETNETQPLGSPWDGYKGCLTLTPDVRQLKLFLKTRQWFVLKEQRAASDLEAVQTAVIHCLSRTEFAPDFGEVRPHSMQEGDGKALADAAKVNRFEYDVQADELIVGFDDGRRLPFGLLSDGQRTMIALVADIARRAATLNPHLRAEAAEKSPGIVLIDEIELHLHPRWQRTIVGDLRETFPRMQFVLTTHSPIIIQSCRPGEVINLDGLNEARDYSEMSPEDILEIEQGMPLPSRSQRMLAMKAAAQKYYAALQGADNASDEARDQLKQQLDALTEPFTDEPAFSAFLRLKRAAAGLED